MRYTFSRYSETLFRAAIALIFIYFGVLAIYEPEITAGRFMSQQAFDFVANFLPINIFMIGNGVVQILIGLGILFRKFYKIWLVLAAILLVAIIINLGLTVNGRLNEVALRDLVILMGITYLFFND